MVKRSRTAVRPGQRRPIQRRAAAPATPSTPESGPRPSAGLTSAEARRAEELEAQIRAEEAAAENARRQARERARDRADIAHVPASIATVADHEYDYVARDLRRIGLVAGFLLAVLAVIWFAVEVLGVIKLG
jgi:hypothetical protein